MHKYIEASKQHWRQLLSYLALFKKSIVLLTLLSILSSVFQVLTAFLSKWLIDKATLSSSHLILYPLIWTGVALLLELCLISYIEYYKSIERTKQLAKLQTSLLETLFQKTWFSMSRFHSGDLLTRINNDANRIIDFWLSTVPNAIALTLHFSMAFFVMYQFDPTLALVAFVLAPITLVMAYPISRKLKGAQRHLQDTESTLQAYITENVQNLSLITLFNHVPKSLSVLKQLQSTLVQSTRKKALLSLLTNGLLFFGYTAGHFMALSFGAYRLSVGLITFGTFTAMLQLVSQIQAPLEGLARSIPQYIVSLASADRLAELAKLPDDAVNHNEPIHDFKQITFENVSFGYKEDHTILKDFSFTINKGDRIAILGPSGSGKTTLSRLLLSLITPTAGNIHLVDTTGNHQPLDATIRSLIAYVPQNNVLFSGTIAQNLRLADESASDADLDRVLSVACAKEFVDQLADGLYTEVGERGIGLSEGQIQRLCIARALLYNKPILILDEATSALDTFAEDLIVTNLVHNFSFMTILMITHRSTIEIICTRFIKL